MLSRCYSEAYQTRYPTYKGCTVHNKWLTFSVFKSWMQTQDWEGKQLDKDLLISGNKCYSSTTCLFVTSQINKLLTDSAAARGLYKKGVTRNGIGKYIASCNVDGKKEHLGCYLTEEAAHQAYLTFKSELVTTVAYNQEDVRIKQEFLRFAEELKQKKNKVKVDTHNLTLEGKDCGHLLTVYQVGFE
jgi:hypothetical protein